MNGSAVNRYGMADYPTTILVAAEDNGLRETLGGNLRDAGYIVWEVSDTASALQFAQIHSRAIHVLVTDDGLLVGRLRPYRPEMKALLLRAKSDRDPSAPQGSGVAERVYRLLQSPRSRQAASGGIGICA